MEYTLDALVAAVAQRLAGHGLDRQDNGQVSAVPDARTLRYYTTLGLMDRPDAVRDRRAVYGDRHVTQAVAVKRLQAQGWSLAAIQDRLAGLRPEQVDAIASGASRSARDFWAEPAAPPVPSPTLVEPAPPARPSPVAAAELAGVEPMVALPLAEGVLLLVAADTLPDPADAAAIREAAAPLLHLLTSRTRPATRRADPAQRSAP